MLAETIKGFNIFKHQSIINCSSDYHPNKKDAKRDPISVQMVATYNSEGNERKVTATDTNKGNSPHKLLTYWLVPEIIPSFILLVN